MFGYRLVAPEEGAYPFTPFVEIVLEAYFVESDATPCLTGQLMTDQEIDERVRILKNDLDRVASLAKEARSRAHKKTLGSVD